MLFKAVNARISNKEPQHATYLMRELLRHARRQVRLFAGDASSAEWQAIFESPEIVDAAKNLLSQTGTKLTIVVDETDEPVISGKEAKPLVRSIEESHEQGKITGTLEIRRAFPEAAKFLKEQHHYFPLMVVDESAYRVETDHPVTPAYANFGDGKIAREYAAFFNDVLYCDSDELVSVKGGSVEPA